MLKNKRHFLNWIKENGTILPIKEKWYILNWLKANNKFNKLYQEVEYIESSNGAYTLIDYYLKGNTEMDLQMLYTNPIKTAGGIFGNNTSLGAGTPENPKYMMTSSSTGELLGFYYYTTALIQIKPSVNVGTLTSIETKVEGNTLKVYVNGELKTTPSNTIVDFTCNQETLLFGVPTRLKNQRIYSCKFSEEGDLKVNLVPCYRKSDGEIGLYDKVNDKFYTNQGTGEFLKGDNK